MAPAAIMFAGIGFMNLAFALSGMGDIYYIISMLWFVSATIMAHAD